EPSTGIVNGNENVIIRGSGFQPGRTSCSVRFGSRDGTNVTILSEEKIQVSTPANESGPQDVVVTFDDGRTFKLAAAFNYRQPDQSKAREISRSPGTAGGRGAATAAPTKK